ncbi:COG1470 family protein [Streptomyces fulvoviolaceus]|uniref:COG1470 family protein n=1 Tax=Streptomyces fulvoviolaceus TaxID=285535 RepID=UPI0021BE5F43|nr:hypothetical protein [Streptomyces fulvoviolaceus]MCT9083461.1 hypothetical protein [Streptomyces fulvoviolaceus]
MPSAARVLSLTLLALLWAAPTATAAEGWSLAPSGGRPVLYAEGEPGAVLQDTVSVANRGDRPVTVRLHADGVTFADAAVRVPARTRADVPFTVTVPADDRTAEIVARDTDGRTQQIRLQLRATVPELSALTVEHVSVRADRITYELVNRGTTTLVPKLTVRADGLFGPVLDRAPRTLPVELPPGRRVELGEPWHDRPALDAVDVRLTVTAAGGARDTAGASAWFVPWGAVAVAGAAGAVAATGALIVVRRRGRRTPEGGEAPQPPRAEAELTGAMT